VKYYILKSIITQSAAGQEVEASMLFSDYQKTDFGFVLPFATEIQLPQITLKTTIKKSGNGEESNAQVAWTLWRVRPKSVQ